ncbi:MAG TPA: hypothetical protein VJU79_05055 [Candidatus Dormibacteraeota bacterium]|nr:hypothetical protein [Candidatus Dormibacteraeota bacterium]
MASAAPHVKLLRQLSDARDDYRSGALDVDWDGGRATLFMVFGQPSHAVFEVKGKARVEGNAALAALLRDLPPRFQVEPWRRAMTPSETLHCTVDDLVHHFAELAAAHAPDGSADDGAPALRSRAGDDSPDLPYDLTGFPLLPGGEAAGPDLHAAEVNVVQLAEQLGSGLITLTGTRLRGAATVEGGQLTDAVWMDAESQVRGETAAMALLGNREGRVEAFHFEPDFVAALPMLWRLSAEQRAMELRWLNPEQLMASFAAGNDDRAVLVDAPNRAVGLFPGGVFSGSYSSADRGPSADPAVFQQLLSQPEGRITVLQGPGRHRTQRPAPPAAVTLVAAEPEPVADAMPAFAAPPEVEPAAVAAVPPIPEVGGDLSIDFGAVRRELVDVCVTWLGEKDAGRAVALIENARPSVDDFVSAIEAIRGLTVPGYDAAVVEGMARELQVRAAERLCAA